MLTNITKTTLSGLSAIIVALAVTACSGAADLTSSDSGTGVSTATVEEADVAAAAAGSLFSGGGANASVSSLTIPRQTLARFVEEAQENEGEYTGDYAGEEGSAQYNDDHDCGEDDPECTCAEVLGEFTAQGGPEGILMSANSDEGHYGSLDAGVDLVEADFCADADGIENTGLAFDDKGRFATFELTEEVGGDCIDENNETTTIAMLPGSTGVWRNTSATETESAHAPEIYGTFNYLINGEEELTLDCTIFLDGEEGISFADCSDENGAVVETDDASTCDLDTE